MDDKARRKELLARYKQNPPEAGVYRIVNTKNNRYFLGSTPNLPSMRSKMEFARTTNSAGVFDRRLREDAQEFGIDAFMLEVLEIVQPKPDTRPEKLREELATLEALWRERFDPALLY
jgi:hypothetical protein